MCAILLRRLMSEEVENGKETQEVAWQAEVEKAAGRAQEDKPIIGG